MLRPALALTALAFAFCVGPAMAQIDEAPKVHARLVAESGSIAPGHAIAVALEEEIRPGWHTYWSNPGDAGAPTAIQWTMPPGWKASGIDWPYPKKLPVGPLMDYGYEGRTWLLVHVSAPPSAVPGTTASLKAAVSWLVCKEVCVPEDTTLVLPLKVDAQPITVDPRVAAQFAAARAKLPVPSPWAMRYRLTDALDLFVAAPSLASAHPTEAEFFPDVPGEVKSTGKQTLGFARDGIVVRLVPSRKFQGRRPLNGVLVLTSADGSIQALNVSAREGLVPETEFMSEANLTFGLALLFAFLGGIILNLMPCVLPVLAMKALALAGHAGAERRAVRNESLAYGAGAIASFIALGLLVVVLRGGGAAIGWGFQLQEPVVVGGFALLMFAVGLNLSGVYEVSPIQAGDVLTRRGGLTGSLFTGVLAVAVAAPCTVPFMAAAVGFALTQSAPLALAVFGFLGLGFAAPFLLLGFFPVLQRLLPKPGRWMSLLRQVLAFPMYGAAVWLAWVVALQAGATGIAAVLAAMVVLGFALWLWGATRTLTAPGRTLAGIVSLVAFIAALSLLAVLRSESGKGSHATVVWPATAIPSQPYSTVRLEELRRQHRAVFVNATAAWCITCLVNDERVLSQPAVRDAFTARHVVYLVADWTSRNGEITALLQAHGRSGVPLYLYYPPGASAAKVLPQVLTVGEVVAAVNGG
jgi:thiol:disulfide interchange protein/DsbC/DsbD-like thiol-disulfide interchange protein